MTVSTRWNFDQKDSTWSRNDGVTLKWLLKRTLFKDRFHDSFHLFDHFFHPPFFRALFFGGQPLMDWIFPANYGRRWNRRIVARILKCTATCGQYGIFWNRELEMCDYETLRNLPPSRDFYPFLCNPFPTIFHFYDSSPPIEWIEN